MTTRRTKLVQPASGVGCFFLAVLLLLPALLGGLALEYTVETWARVLGHAVDIPYPHWATLLLGLLVAKVAIPVVILTLLISAIGLI
jgi:hypothetical protein